MISRRFNDMKRTDEGLILDSIDVTLVNTNCLMNNDSFSSSHVFSFFIELFLISSSSSSAVICSSASASDLTTISEVKFCRMRLWIFFAISCAFFFDYFSHLNALRTLHCLIKFNITDSALS